ncbi:MAG: carbon-nitrogen hydrolase family protein [Lachnospiraceae bacterium]|nr:carbon-nitrogen hydrolase family protein [Lachnospiraceae bacterium]
MATNSVVRVAAVQAAPVYLDTAATVEKTCKLVDEAAAQGAKVIAFPEAFIPGYPWWIWMGNGEYGMKHYIRLYKNAVEIPSDAVKKLSEAAKRNKVYFCVSVTEKDGASLYLTQLWFDPCGNLIGKHRKFKATNAEKTIWGDGDGSMAPVFRTEYGNLGGLQCWEHILPLNLAAMGSQNEQIHVSSWPSFLPGDGDLFGIEVCELCAKYYAVSNQVYCLMSSMIYTEEMREMLCENDYHRQFMALGNGCTEIIAPNAKILASVPKDDKGIAVADVDLDAIIPGKFFTDPTGHYSTPGFLSLTFDQREHVPVKKIGEQANHFISYEKIQDEV